MQLRGARIWIVGGSSGIGAALARELERRQASLALSARRPEALAEVAAGRMAVVPLDVGDRSAVAAAEAQVRRDLGGLDAVVYSVGEWTQMDVADWDGDAFERQVETNLVGLGRVVEAVLPEMRRRRSGTIVGIASVAGYRGITRSEAYSATKAGAIALLESLRIDLSAFGISVVTVCPGFVRTPMTDENDFPMPFMIEADDAARRIADGLAKGKTEIVFPRQMMVLMKAARLVPVRPWAAAYSLPVRRQRWRRRGS